MKVRTFFSILLLIAVSYAMAELAVKNREVLQQDVTLWGGSSLPVGVMLLVFLLLGFLITVVLGISREAGRMLDRWRTRRTHKKAEEIEEEYSRGLVAVLEGREEESLGHFRAVLERDSRHFNTLLKLGEVLRHEGRYADAIEYHRKAQNLKEDDTRPLYALVEDYEAKGDMGRARKVLGKIIGVNKHSVAAWRKLRSLHIKEENWDDALEAHRKVERYSATQEGADRRVGRGIRYEIARQRMRLGKTREAAAMFRRLLKENPQFIPAHVRLGEALELDGQEGPAVEAWQHGFESTGSPIFLTTLEEHYLQKEQPVAAIEALKLCIGVTDKDTLPRFYLGKLYFRLEMLDDAMAVLSSLDGRATYSPTLHYLLGRIHERRRNFGDAASEYRKVIRETELVQVEYRCGACGEESVDWADRCGTCGEWNSIEVNFREEISLDELGLSPAPVYTSRT